MKAYENSEENSSDNNMRPGNSHGQYPKEIEPTEPEIFPCIVVPIKLGGVFYSIPVYIIHSASDLPTELPEILRVIVLKKPFKGKWSKAHKELVKDILKDEAKLLSYRCCFVMNRNQCIYFDNKTDQFSESVDIPSSSIWISDDLFITIMSGGKESRNPNLVEKLRRRIFCRDHRDIGLDVIQAIASPGFVPQIVQLITGKDDEVVGIGKIRGLIINLFKDILKKSNICKGIKRE